MILRVAHSPDSDDAFMFYPMVSKEIDTYDFEIEHILTDIESLNREALKGTYELSAISFHAFPYVADKYLVLPSGGSVGYNYGPVIISKEPISSLSNVEIAIPGELTTAYLVLKLYENNIKPIFTTFDKIFDYVKEGRAKAGLVIHEGQLTYKDMGFHKIVDLGEWWKEKFDLPLPLGCNIVRKDLGKDNIRKIEKMMKDSIIKALETRRKSLEYAKNFAREIAKDEQKVDKFVGMYVNERTVEYDLLSREAVRLLLKLGIEKNIINAPFPKTIFSDEV